jgi:hypothetical protein
VRLRVSLYVPTGMLESTTTVTIPARGSKPEASVSAHSPSALESLKCREMKDALPSNTTLKTLLVMLAGASDVSHVTFWCYKRR